jgi:hypothetical protein
MARRTEPEGRNTTDAIDRTRYRAGEIDFTTGFYTGEISGWINY